MAAQTTYSLTVDKRPALDQHWYDSLREIDSTTDVIGLSRELFTVLGPDHDSLEAMRTTFDAVPYNPDLRPLHGGITRLEQPIRQLAALRQIIASREANRTVQTLYIAKIDEVLLHNRILIAAITGDKAGFNAANHRLYGLPDKTVFRDICAWLWLYSQDYAFSQNTYLRHCAMSMRRLLPQTRGTSKRLFPGNAVFRRVRAMHVQTGGYFEQLLGGQQLPERVTAETGDSIVRYAIAAIGSDYKLADSSDELWGVVHYAKQVVRPPDYNLSRQDYMGIVAHEVGSHLLERTNGANQPLRLLEVGLDRYEAGNEGRAFLREQLAYNSPYDMQHNSGWQYIILKHLAISLASGLHKQAYDFRSLYDTMFSVCHFFQALKRPDDPSIAQATAHSETWHLLTRILKGTDGFGGAYLKDIVYLEGNLRAWKLATYRPHLILFGDAGKFDIARRDQRQLLSTIGLTASATHRLRLAGLRAARP